MLSSPSSSDSVLLDIYLESGDSQAVKNIIRVGRVLRIEDALLCQLMQNFDAYKLDCHVSCGTLEAMDFDDFMRTYARLPDNIKDDFAREFLESLLQDDSVVNRFNLFISLHVAYRETIDTHQQAAVMLSSLQQKIREKVSVVERANVQNLVLTRLEEKPQVMTRLTYLQTLNANLNKAKAKPDILALFFLEPFTFSNEILAKIKIPENFRKDVVDALILAKYLQLTASLSANPPNWREGTWAEAKVVYQVFEALTDQSSEPYQEILQRANTILKEQTTQLFDLEKKRNLILRLDLSAKENFMAHLEALKAHTQWCEDLPFEEAKKNLARQIKILEDYKAALKVNKEEGFLSFLQNQQAPVPPLPSAQSTTSVLPLPPVKPTPPVTPVANEKPSAVLEEKKPKPSFMARLKTYSPFILTAVAAFTLSFYSTPLMLLTLMAGTGGGILLQRRAQVAAGKVAVEKPIAIRVPSAAEPSKTTSVDVEALISSSKTHLVHPLPANEAQAALAREREQRANAALARLAKPNC